MMLRTLLLEVMSCAIKAKFHTMMIFGERAYATIAPTLIDCRGNPLWLPLWTHFEAVCVT